ncbi:cytosolic 5'-nucleotidase 3-like isoform X2 [Pygocentrus nattereri]|uniref:cytosolic 5'-nucleotidase 3-like isoform X2 n=1 Tax=Pygocentrus nattereri TaxID=42514 RepID=UPI00189173AA|nr:cytosolic 5'-nucleotidase 3-like isoform X2 [Pygocentrus nattereri]
MDLCSCSECPSNLASADKIPELKKPSVIMRDRGRVEEIIRNMHGAGPGALQVISDFDMTLTRFAFNGKRCPTSHNILDNSSLISEDCKAKLANFPKSHYYPIEIDSSLSVEDKVPHMVEWWTQAHDLLVQQRIKKDQLAKAVRESDAMLRDGYEVFFGSLKDHSIPLLIFSAGLGDILEEVIEHNGVFHPNVRVFSNYMEFDKNGLLCSFKGQLIHTFNKREGALLNPDQFEQLQDRPNILLLGDSMGDLTMADGVQNVQNILRIGYLNDKVEERRDAYVGSYDIVLEKDETLDIPNAILRYITEGK